MFRRAIPLIQTPALMECGPACLAMVLGYHGRTVPLDELVAATRSQHGSDAATLLDAAQSHGLIGNAVRADLDQLAELPRASILHWEFSHFVVLESVEADGIRIVDPADGRRFVGVEELNRSFTGVALVFEPGESFVPVASPPYFRTHLREILRDPGLWARILVTSLVMQCLGLGFPLLAGLAIDRVVPAGERGWMVGLGLGAAGLVAFNLLTALARGALLVALRAQVDGRLTSHLIRHSVELPLQYFELKGTGDLVARFRSPAAIRDVLTSTALSALIDGVLLLTYLGFILAIDPITAACVLGVAALLVAFLALTRRKMRDLAADALFRGNRTFAHLVELLYGIETVKATGFGKVAAERYLSEFTRQVNATSARDWQQAIWEAVVSSLRLACPLSVLVLGTWRAMAGQFTVGQVLELTTLASGFFLPLSTLLGTALSLELIEQHFRNVQDIVAAAPEQEGAARRPAPVLRGEISLERAWFQYPGKDSFRIEECSLQIRAGEFVAIVGRSGSGKSTLAKLLAGVYAPSGGRVSFDGVDLAELELDSVRRQIGFVPQRPVLIGKSIRRIIAGGRKNITLEQVTRACRSACVHDEVAALALGYETALKPEGGVLSGGQRQRIALARALVGAPCLLLLDEATSALDAQTESAVQSQLETLSCTRVVVAHRLSSVFRADRIFVMADGRVVEQGRHSELVTRSTVYRELMAAQLNDPSQADRSRGAASG